MDFVELLGLVDGEFKNTPFPDLYKKIIGDKYVSPDSFIRKCFGNYAFDNRPALQVVANYLRTHPLAVKSLCHITVTDAAKAALSQHGETEITLLDRLYAGDLGRVSDEEIVKIRLRIFDTMTQMPLADDSITMKYYIRSNNGNGEEIMVKHSIYEKHSIIYMPWEEM
jgi:hypothetical protein